MLVVRYTAWDGTQQVRLDAEQVFEKLSEYLSYTDDVQQALDWLLRPGPRARRHPRARARRPARAAARGDAPALPRLQSPRRAGRDAREARGAARSRARDARRARRPGAAQGASAKQLDDLPPRLSDALAAARRLRVRGRRGRGCSTRRCATSYENIRDLENFERRYGDLFHGPRALELRRGARADARDGGVEAPRGAAPGRATSTPSIPSSSASSSGARRLRSFQLLQGMMRALAQAGYVTQREGTRGAVAEGRAAHRPARAARHLPGPAPGPPGGHATDQRGVTRAASGGDATLPLRRSAGARPGRARSRRRVARRPGTPLRARARRFRGLRRGSDHHQLDRAAAST